MIGVICIIAFFVIVAFYLKNNWRFFDWGDFAYPLVTAAILPFIGFLIAFVVTSVSFYNTQPALGEYTETKLSALSNTQGVEGQSYFLGSGYINGTQQLSFIEDHGDFSIVNQVQAGPQALIYQDSGSRQPWMSKQEFVQDAWFLWPGWEWKIYKDNYTFHIPEGSIVSDYVIDVSR